MVALVLLLSFTSHALNYATLDHQRDAAVLTPLHVPLLRNRFTELAGCFPTCIFTNVLSKRILQSLSPSNNAADWPWCLVLSQGSCSNWSSFSRIADGSKISALGGDRCMYLLGRGISGGGQVLVL